MNDATTVGEQLDKHFITVGPDTTATKAEEELVSARAIYCILTTEEGEPLALATIAQLKKADTICLQFCTCQ